jgi:hypothetical protein
LLLDDQKPDEPSTEIQSDVTNETTLEPAAEITSSKDTVAEDIPTTPDATTEIDSNSTEVEIDNGGVADVSGVTSAITEADMAGDTTTSGVSSCMADSLRSLHQRRIWISF